MSGSNYFNLSRTQLDLETSRAATDLILIQGGARVNDERQLLASDRQIEVLRELGEAGIIQLYAENVEAARRGERSQPGRNELSYLGRQALQIYLTTDSGAKSTAL